MKRSDRVVVPDDYEQYERMEQARAFEERITALEAKINELESWILDK